MIELRRIGKVKEGRKILENISFKVEKEEFFMILGGERLRQDCPFKAYKQAGGSHDRGDNHQGTAHQGGAPHGAEEKGGHDIPGAPAAPSLILISVFPGILDFRI